MQILPQIMHQNSTDICIKITHISCVKFMVHFSHRICTKNNDIFIRIVIVYLVLLIIRVALSNDILIFILHTEWRVMLYLLVKNSYNKGDCLL